MRQMLSAPLCNFDSKKQAHSRCALHQCTIITNFIIHKMIILVKMFHSAFCCFSFPRPVLCGYFLRSAYKKAVRVLHTDGFFRRESDKNGRRSYRSSSRYRAFLRSCKTGKRFRNAAASSPISQQRMPSRSGRDAAVSPSGRTALLLPQ